MSHLNYDIAVLIVTVFIFVLIVSASYMLIRLLTQAKQIDEMERASKSKDLHIESLSKDVKKQRENFTSSNKWFDHTLEEIKKRHNLEIAKVTTRNEKLKGLEISSVVLKSDNGISCSFAGIVIPGVESVELDKATNSEPVMATIRVRVHLGEWCGI